MQFDLSGEPNWYASRAVALSFGPFIIGLVTLIVLPGGWFVQGVAGLGGIGVQALYVSLVSRWVDRSKD